jgi:hypothetical protein
MRIRSNTFFYKLRQMHTYIQIPVKHSEDLLAMNGKIKPLCEKIERNAEGMSCYPLPGNLMTVIRILSKNQIEYEIKVIDFIG